MLYCGIWSDFANSFGKKKRSKSTRRVLDEYYFFDDEPLLIEQGFGKKKRKSKPRRTHMRYYRTAEHARSREPGISSGSGCSSRRSAGECGSNPNCSWSGSSCHRKSGSVSQGPLGPSGFGSLKSINPANLTNYQYQQWATNAATPSLKQLDKIAGTATYSYPLVFMTKVPT